MKKYSNILFIPAHLAKLKGTGSLERCRQALKAWKSKQYDYIVTSGGALQDKSIHTLPIADQMKQWLVKKGVPKDKILSENRSSETYTNVHFSLNLLKKKKIKIKNFIIVSIWSHILRIRIILWRNYKIKALGIPVKHKFSILEWMLEPIFFINSLIDKSGNGFLRRMIRKHAKKFIKLIYKS